MPAKKKPVFTQRYVFAKNTFSAREPGSKYPTTVPQGSVWHADCPMVTSHPAEFSDEPPVVFPRGWQPKVEQATAAPGEVRDSGRDDG
jgi:hypothetical protein